LIRDGIVRNARTAIRENIENILKRRGIFLLPKTQACRPHPNHP